jgi:acyl-CoA synthetase (AMP-forming)/AMP-acid ligase II
MNTLCQLINQQAQQTPHNIYMLEESSAHSLTYEGLLSSCAAVTQLVSAQGLQPGDIISVVMPNGANTLRILLGAMWGGYCVNPVNLLSQPDQMRYVLEHSDCKLIVASPEWTEKLQELLKGISRPIKVLITSEMMESIPGETHVSNDQLEAFATHLESQVSPQTPALLMYTSGTTGVPKGVLLTQSQLAHNALSIVAEHGLTEHDRVLAVLPLYHINAFMVTMLAPLVSGGSLALVARFSVGRFWQQTSDMSCSWINLVPTMVSYLLEHEAPHDSVTESIKFCRSASASLPPEHLQGFENKFGVGVIETMGLTETAAPAFSNPLNRSERKLGSVGKQTGCEAAVIDHELSFVADGVTGEVVIKGNNVMLGYYKNPTATASTFTPDGWLRTGDLGHRDSDGFFFITGRIKELIIKGGENIAPREIDEVLLRHPDVLDAASVGIPDKHYGQEIMVCIVLRPDRDVSEHDLRVFCDTHLGKFKSPKTIHFVTELPRGPSGKVQRLKLPEFILNLDKGVQHI